LPIINGIDVSDPTQNFMDEEWRKLLFNGRWSYVAQACEQINGWGCGGCDGRGGQGDGHGGGCWNDDGGGHNIGAMGMDHNDSGKGTEMSGKGNNGAGGDHGAQHGHGFGCGVYRH
jgi:hypothetical protein